MRFTVIGLGTQGKKRASLLGTQLAASVDPVNPDAMFRDVKEVPVGDFDAAFVCTGEDQKLDIIQYLLELDKHVLVEKPLMAGNSTRLEQLRQIAEKRNLTLYTAYNHRFEPSICRLKELLDRDALGSLYFAKFFYGNGTARDVRNSAWRDKGLGVLADLGSHLLDLVFFLFGKSTARFELFQHHTFENRGSDHCLFGTRRSPDSRIPALLMETTLLSWKNDFSIDLFGENGSAHVQGLNKWGRSSFTFRERVLPSGRPLEESFVTEMPDRTWKRELDHFIDLCQAPRNSIDKDIWIQETLLGLHRSAGREG